MSPLSEVVFRMIQDVPQRIPGDVEPCIGFIFSMGEQIAVSVKAHDAFIIGDDPIDHQLIIAQVRQQHAETLPATGIVDILIDRLPVFLADICTGCQQGEHRFVCGRSACPAIIEQGRDIFTVIVVIDRIGCFSPAQLTAGFSGLSVIEYRRDEVIDRCQRIVERIAVSDISQQQHEGAAALLADDRQQRQRILLLHIKQIRIDAQIISLFDDVGIQIRLFLQQLCIDLQGEGLGDVEAITLLQGTDDVSPHGAAVVADVDTEGAEVCRCRIFQQLLQ